MTGNTIKEDIMAELLITELSGKQTTLQEATVAEFQKSLRGDVYSPGDLGYDDARALWNGNVDKRPAIIAKCDGVADVMRCVNFARDNTLLVSVRGGGHSFPGTSVANDGLVIDLSKMCGVRVDPVRRTARAEGGAKWGAFDHATQAFGLACTGGTNTDTGIGGLTLGGGHGWLGGKHGLALDNLISVDIVTADGQLRIASGIENPDLFWAIRGGGGNFGVVTTFEFQVHPLRDVLAGVVLHPAAVATDAIRWWRDLEATAPNESTQGALLFHFPDDATAPPPLRGAAVVGLGGVYAGSVAEGDKFLGPLRHYGSPLADTFQSMPYSAAQRMADFLWPAGLHGYWKSSYLTALSDEAVRVIVDFFARVPSPRTVIVLEHNGDSAWSCIPDDATAFGHRTWPYNFLVTSAWSDPRDTKRNIAWTREFFEAMRRFAAPGAYVNYLGGDEGVAGLEAAYGAKLARLRAIKAKFDPENFFRINQNIAPS